MPSVGLAQSWSQHKLGTRVSSFKHSHKSLTLIKGGHFFKVIKRLSDSQEELRWVWSEQIGVPKLGVRGPLKLRAKTAMVANFFRLLPFSTVRGWTGRTDTSVKTLNWLLVENVAVEMLLDTQYDVTNAGW
jgi:hypothetical protein